MIALVRGEQPLTNPPAETLLEEGDSLVLVGSHGELDRAIGDAVAVGSALELAVHVPTPDDQAVANCDLEAAPATNLIQNGGPDAITLTLDGTVVDRCPNSRLSCQIKLAADLDGAAVLKRLFVRGPGRIVVAQQQAALSAQAAFEVVVLGE